MAWIIFIVLSFLCLGGVVAMILSRNQAHNALFLVLSFAGLGGIFGLLEAPFAAVVQVLVYAGAIMVLFLFIVMMLRLTPSRRTGRHALSQWAPATVLGGLALILAAVMISADPATGPALKTLTAGPKELALFLFQKYWFPVEIASFLLLIALVGALFLGRQEKKAEKTTRPEGL
jgi:NADH-quinone oxidoreductase subunit J